MPGLVLLHEQSVARHELDVNGRSVLVGLTFPETCEFEQLDASLPFGGKCTWLDDEWSPSSELRWLALWTMHRTAIQKRRVRSRVWQA